MTLPLRGRIHRFAFLFLVIGATALMLLSRTNNPVVERVSAVVTDVFSPVMDVLSRPAASVKELVQTVRGFAHLREENVRLTRENERLLAWQESAHRLAAQNEVLQSLLDYKPGPKAHFVTARVIGDSGGAFVRSVLINAGTSQGISKGQAAVTGKGLAGQVVQVGYRSARVLLITDINSRVPVLVEGSRKRAILAGDNGILPRLTFLPVNASVAPGDRVVTSGHGGVFPPGLPVGRITVADDGVLRVAPFFELDRLEYIRLVDYVRIEPLVGDHTTERKASSR
jgi:rod shape-determining protein MreC